MRHLGSSLSPASKVTPPPPFYFFTPLNLSQVISSTITAAQAAVQHSKPPELLDFRGGSSAASGCAPPVLSCSFAHGQVSHNFNLDQSETPKFGHKSRFFGSNFSYLQREIIKLKVIFCSSCLQFHFNI